MVQGQRSTVHPILICLRVSELPALSPHLTQEAALTSRIESNYIHLSHGGGVRYRMFVCRTRGNIVLAKRHTKLKNRTLPRPSLLAGRSGEFATPIDSGL